MLSPIAPPDDPARACLAGPSKYQFPDYRARTQTATHRLRLLATAIPFSCSSSVSSSATRAFQPEICPPRECLPQPHKEPRQTGWLTRRREGITQEVQTSCDALCQPRPCRQGSPLKSTTQPSSRVRVQKKLLLFTSRDDSAANPGMTGPQIPASSADPHAVTTP